MFLGSCAPVDAEAKWLTKRLDVGPKMSLHLSSDLHRKLPLLNLTVNGYWAAQAGVLKEQGSL